jgi:hypothetical protein
MKQENFFAIQTRCFKVGGFEKRHKVLNVIQLCLIADVFFCAFTEGHFVLKNIRNVLAAAEGFAPFATSVLGIVKIATFFISLDDFYALIERIKSLNKTSWL